jgi:hypothetical protein
MKYIVADGHSFTSKGIMYVAGTEISISAFSNEEAFKKLVEKKHIIKVDISNPDQGSDTTDKNSQTGNSVELKINAFHRKEIAEAAVKTADEIVISAENDLKNAENVFDVAKEAYLKALDNCTETAGKNMELLAARDTLSVVEEELKKAKKPEAKAAAESKYNGLKNHVLTIMSDDAGIRKANETLNTANESWDKAENAKVEAKVKIIMAKEKLSLAKTELAKVENELATFEDK